VKACEELPERRMERIKPLFPINSKKKQDSVNRPAFSDYAMITHQSG
jgi:hypothetical protein